MTDIDDTIQYIADLREGEVITPDECEPDCGQYCFLFGIEMGYHDMDDYSLDVCGCDKEERGYECGRKLSGNPVTRREEWINYIKNLLSR